MSPLGAFCTGAGGYYLGESAVWLLESKISQSGDDERKVHGAVGWLYHRQPLNLSAAQQSIHHGSGSVRRRLRLLYRRHVLADRRSERHIQGLLQSVISRLLDTRILVLPMLLRQCDDQGTGSR